MTAALRYLRGNRTLLGAFIADLALTLLAVPNALLPALNATRFGGSATGLGILTAGLTVGGIAASLLSGFTTQVRRQGNALLFSGAIWGTFVALLGWCPSFWPAIVLLAAVGAADAITLIFGQTIVQNTTEDTYRGRVSATEHIVQMGGPQLGNFRAGLAGSLGGTGVGLVSGGLAAVACMAAIALLIQPIRKYESPPISDDVTNAH